MGVSETRRTYIGVLTTRESFYYFWGSILGSPILVNPHVGKMASVEVAVRALLKFDLSQALSRLQRGIWTADSMLRGPHRAWILDVDLDTFSTYDPLQLKMSTLYRV